MGIIEEKLFFSGTNSDDEDRKLQPGDFRFALNVETDNVDSSNVGAAVNSKGNRLVSIQLPAGTNKVIGSKEDLDTNSCIYFLYNSNGNHSIYKFSSDVNRIDLVMQTSLFNFSLDHRINHINVVDEKLLLWTDGYNPPRQINLDKAIEFNKRRKWNIYWGDTFNVGQYYDTTLFFPNGSVAFTWRTTIPSGLTPSDAYGMSRYYVSNIPITLRTFASFTTCGASVEIEMMITGEYSFQILPSLSNQSIIVADNFYPTPYDEVFIDRLKQPFHCQPEAVYGADPTRKTNLVQNRVFQFATRYIYDDYEKSAISPYSIIPVIEAQCGAQQLSSPYNFIEIDFTETRLNNPSFRSSIRGIDIIFREQNTGKLKLATTLLPEDFGIGLNIYRFYNDGIYSGIPDADAAKNFDSIPITSGAQEYVNNRIFDSDILEGYNTSCIDANLTVNFEQSISAGFNISGSAFISNTFIPPIQGYGFGTDDRTSNHAMPLFKTSLSNNVGNTVFGGVKLFPGFTTNKYITDSLADRYSQYCPFNGLTFFLNGTDYYGITRQKTVPGIAFQDPATGLLGIDTQPEWQATVNTVLTGAGFEQQWTIQGVPPGWYSLRVANPTIAADKLTDRSYQKTSAPILRGAAPGNPLEDGGVAGTGEREAVLEITNTGTINVYHPVTGVLLYATATGQLKNSFIADVASQYNDWERVGMQTYVIDGENNPLPGTINSTIQSPAVSRSTVKIGYFDNFAAVGPFLGADTMQADHNGYAYSSIYFVDPSPPGPNPGMQAQAAVIEITNQITTVNATGLTLVNYYLFPTTFINSPAASTADYGAYTGLYRYSTQLYIDGRTFIDGYIYDPFGLPATNIGVTDIIGNHTTTDSYGHFLLPVYATNTTQTPQSSWFILYGNGICDLSIFTNYNPYTVAIGPTANNSTNTYPVANLVASFLPSQDNGLKRGSDFQYGIVYYDRGNRSSTVNTGEKLKLHVPFYTEDYQGVLHTSEMVVVGWEIKNIPPDWATHYQWVRTKNLQLNTYLQFVADTVEYVDTTAGTDVGYTAGNLAKISLANIAFYAERNPGSLVAYTWQEGDRIRFIKNGDGVYFGNYFDLPVLSQDGDAIFVTKDQSIGELLDGCFFEIYSPRLATDKKLYYEIGECYEVLKDASGNPYHEGQLQNQDPLNPVTIPATGVFQSGDAWYRKRQMPYDPGAAVQYLVYVVDDASISDFYLSKDDNIGRINIEDLDAQQIKREKTVRFSDVYVKESKLNGLSSYSALNYENIKKGEGPVYKLQRSGRVLLAIQRSQVNSLYIEEIVYIDANGNPSLTVSDKVIGTIRPQELQYGSVHPESVREYAGVVYWYDVTKGTVIRYSNDGLTPVGDYKMKSFFRNISRDVLQFPAGQIEVVGGYDPLNKRYLLSFIKRDNLLNFVNRTCGFSEPSNRWKGDYSFIPESMAMTGMDIVSFKNGELWVHDNPVRNNFYGIQYTSKLGAVSNQDSGKVRNFMAISEESNEVWSCPEIEVPPNAQYPSGMMSRLIKQKFVNKEGVFYSAFLKDINSPNFATQNEALIGGRDLRGHVLRITLENDSTTPVVLNAINVRYIYSEPSKQ